MYVNGKWQELNLVVCLSAFGAVHLHLQQWNMTHKNNNLKFWWGNLTEKSESNNSNIQNSLHRFENISLLFEIEWNFIEAVGF